MNSFLDSEILRERETQNGLPRSKFRAKFGPKRRAGISELDPCLARVRREQKAASKGARFGVHFTQIVTFSAFAVAKEPPKKSGVMFA